MTLIQRWARFAPSWGPIAAKRTGRTEAEHLRDVCFEWIATWRPVRAEMQHRKGPLRSRGNYLLGIRKLRRWPLPKLLTVSLLPSQRARRKINWLLSQRIPWPIRSQVRDGNRFSTSLRWNWTA